MHGRSRAKQLAPKIKKKLLHGAAERGAGTPEHNNLARKVKKAIKRRSRV